MSPFGSGLEKWGPAIAMSSLDAGQIDAVEEQRQIVGVDFQSVLADLASLPQSWHRGAGRQLEGAFFESLVPQAKAIGFEVEQLDAVAAPGAKDEEVAGEWIAAEMFADHAGEAVEAAAHVGGERAQEDAGWQS